MAFKGTRKKDLTVTDPITTQLIKGALQTLQKEMESLIERTAMSPFIREKKDFFSGVFDTEGQLIVGT